ncbi:hypothetical protein G6F37_008665 [Rhizopus arrhizus]|nr:hypothetical protein G6F38_008739 [Rhizopus arrhizus]KAG1155304.1 hypothetical protein G6F37_008665 [Rhizopus arrhizus]
MSLTLKHAVVTRRAKLFVDGSGGLQMQCTVKYDGVFYSLGSYNPIVIALFLKHGLEEAMFYVQGPFKFDTFMKGDGHIGKSIRVTVEEAKLYPFSQNTKVTLSEQEVDVVKYNLLKYAVMFFEDETRVDSAIDYDGCLELFKAMHGGLYPNKSFDSVKWPEGLEAKKNKQAAEGSRLRQTLLAAAEDATDVLDVAELFASVVGEVPALGQMKRSETEIGVENRKRPNPKAIEPVSGGEER